MAKDASERPAGQQYVRGVVTRITPTNTFGGYPHAMSVVIIPEDRQWLPNLFVKSFAILTTHNYKSVHNKAVLRGSYAWVRR